MTNNKLGICFDYKELEILKNALENEIESLGNQNFAGIENDTIYEYTQVLIKIIKEIKINQNKENQDEAN